MKNGHALKPFEVVDKESFASLIRQLETRLYDRFIESHSSRRGRIDASYDAGLSQLDWDEDVSYKYEYPNSFPMPALTHHGIVFTYQTYEKGSNADGTLHFLFHNPAQSSKE